jgi:putative hydrolase of the HAD superfamily
MPLIDALILDFGEVLVRPQSAASIQRLADLAGLEIADFRERYWQHRLGYDSGLLSDAEYWRRVTEGALLQARFESTLQDLMTADFMSWTDYREEMWDLTLDFKSRGGRTALLSNGVPAVMDTVRSTRPLAGHFDAVVVSYEVGCVKPDPRIYQICLAQLGAQAVSTLFVDDRLENLEAAGRQGIQTFHFLGDHSLSALQARLRDETRP